MLLFFKLNGVWLAAAAFCLSLDLFWVKMANATFIEIISAEKKKHWTWQKMHGKWLKSFVNTNWTWSLNARLEKWQKTVICESFYYFYLRWWALLKVRKTEVPYRTVLFNLFAEKNCLSWLDDCFDTSIEDSCMNFFIRFDGLIYERLEIENKFFFNQKSFFWRWTNGIVSGLYKTNAKTKESGTTV